MKKCLKVTVLICFFLSILTGCQDNDEIIELKLGAYAFGIEYYERFEFEYNGSYVRIPYFVEGFAPICIQISDGSCM